MMFTYVHGLLRCPCTLDRRVGHSENGVPLLEVLDRRKRLHDILEVVVGTHAGSLEGLGQAFNLNVSEKINETDFIRYNNSKKCSNRLLIAEMI